MFAPLTLHVLEFAAAFTAIAFQWMVQSTVVIAVGLAAAWLVHRRGPALRSAIYRATLLVVIACPLATGLASTSRVASAVVWLPSFPPTVMAIVPDPPQRTGDQADRMGNRDELGEGVNPSEVRADISAHSPSSAIVIDGTPAQGQFGPEANSRSFASRDARHRTTRSGDAGLTAATTWRIQPAAAAFVIGVVIIWIAGSGYCLARLALEYFRVVSMCRTATSADKEERRLCEELSATLGVAPPRLLRSPNAPGPCLAGLWRHAILLPEERDNTPLTSILIHELTHLRRGDCQWNLLGQVVRSVLFFQPLLGRLCHHIEETAEEVCDDHVVHLGADRNAYAHALVRLAEQASVPIATVVPLVRFRSLLGRRVQRILDHSHHVSLRVGGPALCHVLIASTGLTVAMGFVACGPKQSGSAESERAGGKVETGAAQPNGASVRGRVAMPDGKPAAGAHLALIARRRHGADDAILLAQARSDASGRFDVSATNLSSARYRWVQLLARSGDTGLAWQDVTADSPQQDLTINLPNAAPTRGRLVTLEGQPAKGVRLRVGEIFRVARGEFEGVYANRGALPAAIWPNNVTSDHDGWYTVPGVPGDVQVGLHIEQEPYAADDWPLDSGHVQPRNQIRVLAPAQIIEGIVVAAETGQPLADASVRAMQASASPGHGLMSVLGKTDAKGRFRLNPYASKAYVVTAMGPVGTPYLAQQLNVQWSETAQEHQLRMKLPRGVLVKGTIMEEPGGKTLADATVRYTNRIDNKFAKDIPLIGIFQPLALSDEQGRFALAVPAGAGHLTVDSTAEGHVLQELRVEKLTGRNRPGGERLQVSAHEALDIPADALEHVVQLKVRRASTLRSGVVGNHGEELSPKSRSATPTRPAPARRTAPIPATK